MSGRGGAEKNVLYSDWKEKYVQSQSWTRVVPINCKIWNTAIMDSMVVMTLNSHRGSPGLIPRRNQIYYLLLPRNWRVKTMGAGGSSGGM